MTIESPIFKYVGPEVVSLTLTDEGVVFKCSHPKDFNDPYELFLTINFNESPEALAFYEEVVGDLPQLPTTCFSVSPSITPMWAHYGKNHEGIAVQLDEKLVEKYFPKSGFGSVDYEDGPPDDLTELLYRAFVIQKPRYTYLLRQGVFSAAYYTKQKCWSYEQERRMVCSQEETYENKNSILIKIPKECVVSIIVGARSNEETIDYAKRYAASINCKFFEMKIGKSSIEPYFLCENGKTHIFNGVEICPSSFHCKKCKEPTESSETCSWCSINDIHRESAASINPYRMMAGLGMLENYIESMDEISEKHR